MAGRVHGRGACVVCVCVCVCVCVAGGVCGMEYAWEHACMTGSVVTMGGGHVWQGCVCGWGMHGRGHAWQGASIAGETATAADVRILLECILVVNINVYLILLTYSCHRQNISIERSSIQ